MVVSCICVVVYICGRVVYMCGSVIDFTFFYDFSIDFRTVPTLWYKLFFNFILLAKKTGHQKYCDINYSRRVVNEMWILKHSNELPK